MIRSYELMAERSLLEKDEDLRKQLAELYRHLSALLKALPAEGPKRRISLDPDSQPRLPLKEENLGTVFIKRGIGVPLFGYYRPSKVPAEEGPSPLLRNARRPAGWGRLDAVWKDASTHIDYHDLG